MAGKLTDYMENEILDHVLKVGVWSRPANLWCGLCTADPTDVATGANITELSGGGYTRIACDTWGAAASRAIANSSAITFSTASADWSTVTHFVIIDSASGVGNVLAYGTITPNKTVEDTEDCALAIGDLDISMDAGGMSDYLANELLDHIFKGDAYTPPTNIWIALSDTTIIGANTGTTISEHTAEGYARINDNNWGTAVGGSSDNDAIITFGAATASWGTITDWALIDADAVGNMLFFAELTTSKDIDNGDTGDFAAGALVLTVD